MFYSKRFKYLPNFGLTCIVMLLSLFVFSTELAFNQGRIGCHGPNGYKLPEADNDANLIGLSPYVVQVHIDKWGDTFLNLRRVRDFSLFKKDMEDLMDEFDAPQKILIKVHRDTEFGKIQWVLREAKKAGFETAGLITNEKASYFDLLH